jgi:muramoyltetrapeptide carboxypeptidase
MGNIVKQPELLKEGDSVIVVAPSGRVNIDLTKEAISLIESWGLNVETGEHLYKRDGIFAGSDEERSQDLQKALDRPDIRAIFCARGGYGLSRIIDRLDFSGFEKAPKWLVGFSDVTVLHTEIIRSTSIPVIHGEMPLNYSDRLRFPESLSTLKDALFAGQCSYQWSPKHVKQGETRAIVAGGNLSLLYNLLGTGMDDFLSGKILFIEETNEQLYRLDRMLMGLKLADVFRSISGLLVGGMTDITDSNIPFGRSLAELILEVVEPYDIPVAFNFPAGHMKDNRAIYLGKEAFFRVDSLSAVLSY